MMTMCYPKTIKLGKPYLFIMGKGRDFSHYEKSHRLIKFYLNAFFLILLNDWGLIPIKEAIIF